MRLLHCLPAALLTVFLFTSANAHATGVDEASKYLDGVGNQAIATISDKKTSKEQKQRKLEKIFSENVDIEWVGRFVMGRFWRQATDEQKTRYLKEYQKFLLVHYTSRFTDYTSGSFKITGGKDDGDNEYTISMQIQGSNAKDEPVLVDYRIRKEESGFRIFDIIVEGVSLITTQRSEFSSVITNHSIDYLIEQLAMRKELSASDK